MVDFDATFFAHVVNFIVLFAILGKFAFRPLMNVLDERANRIVNDLDSAEKTRVEAEELKTQYTQQMEEARNEAAAIVAKATQNAQAIEAEARTQAQAEKDQMISAAKQNIENEKQQAIADVRKQVIALATEIAGKVVSQKLDSPEDQALIARTADGVL